MKSKRNDDFPKNPRQGDKHYFACPISGVGDDYIYLDGRWRNLGWGNNDKELPNLQELAKVKWFA